MYFSLLIGWDSHIASIVKIASNKIGALICSMKFQSSKVVLYLNLRFGLVLNTVIMSGLVLLIANLDIFDPNRYVRLLLLPCCFS